MKKAFKWIILGLLIACGIAYIVCYSIMKEETIEFTNKVIEFVNQPLPIIGVSVIALGGVVIKILSMSSWGKKKVSELTELVAKFKEDIEANKNTYEEQKQALQSQIDSLKSLLEESIKLNPNKKIRELLDETKVDDYEK